MVNGIRKVDSRGFNKGRGSVKVPDKHQKKEGGHIGRNVVEIEIKTIVRKPLMIKTNEGILYFEINSSGDK